MMYQYEIHYWEEYIFIGVYGKLITTDMNIVQIRTLAAMCGILLPKTLTICRGGAEDKFINELVPTKNIVSLAPDKKENRWSII